MAGWIGAIAQIGGSIIEGLSGSSASDEQERAAEIAANTQRYFYDTTRSDYQPYMRSGYGALNEINRQLGLPSVEESIPALPGQEDPILGYAWKKEGKVTRYDVNKAFQAFKGRNATKEEWKFYTKKGRERARHLYDWIIAPGLERYRKEQEQKKAAAAPAAGTPAAGAAGDGTAAEDDRYGAFRATPGYQFRVDEAERAIQRHQSATGRMYSGAALREAARYSQGLADQEYTDYYNRLAGLAGVGQTATNSVSNYGAQTAANIGSAQLYSGAARASGVLGAGSAAAGALSGAADLYDWWTNRQRDEKSGGGGNMRGLDVGWRG